MPGGPACPLWSISRLACCICRTSVLLRSCLDGQASPQLRLEATAALQPCRKHGSALLVPEQEGQRMQIQLRKKGHSYSHTGQERRGVNLEGLSQSA